MSYWPSNGGEFTVLQRACAFYMIRANPREMEFLVKFMTELARIAMGNPGLIVEI